jgi:hypothetical protein
MSVKYMGLDAQEKGAEDWRAFLYFMLDGVQFELRGYGNTSNAAKRDALRRYNDPTYMSYMYNIDIDEN